MDRMKTVLLFPLKCAVALLGLCAMFGRQFCEELGEQCVVAMRMMEKR